jgi:hypothetical protein
LDLREIFLLLIFSPTEIEDNIDYRVVVSRFLESKNKISFSSIVLPLEYRWRKSSIDEI